MHIISGAILDAFRAVNEIHLIDEFGDSALSALAKKHFAYVFCIGTSQCEFPTLRSFDLTCTRKLKKRLRQQCLFMKWTPNSIKLISRFKPKSIIILYITSNREMENELSKYNYRTKNKQIIINRFGYFITVIVEIASTEHIAPLPQNIAPIFSDYI